MLVVCVFASALGGLIMCLLVLRDVLSPAAAHARRTDHDVQITRVGYVIAGACFASTALLSIVLVARTPLPPVQPRVGVPEARITERLTALDRDRDVLAEQVGALAATMQKLRAQVATVDGGVQGMRTRLDQTESRMLKAESGLTRAEAGLRRVGEEVAQANARTRQAERSAATKPIVVGPREIIVPAPPPPPPPPPRRSEVEPYESAPLTIRPTAASAPAPVPPQAAVPRQAATIKPAPSAAASSPQDPPAQGLADKVRNDWNVIRRGFSTVGDDLSAAMRDFGRRATGRD